MFPKKGGGQPSDIGIISTPSYSIPIHRVTLDRSTGIVTHYGKIENENHMELAKKEMVIGTKVQVQVDSNHRQIISECHSAGHIVDVAMERCGFQLPPTKGYHFLDGPYVEYKGKLPAEKSKPEIVASLQEAFQVRWQK